MSPHCWGELGVHISHAESSSSYQSRLGVNRAAIGAGEGSGAAFRAVVPTRCPAVSCRSRHRVTDNLRIWAERLAGTALGGGTDVPGYDQALLGRARAYNQLPVAGALWSLRHAATEWAEAIDLARSGRVVLVHAGRGRQHLADVAHNNAHDACYHEWDIRRTLDRVGA